MEFIKRIREEVLSKNAYQMHKLMGLSNTTDWIRFESRKESINAKKLIKLWRISGLSADEFMQMIADEVEKTD